MPGTAIEEHLLVVVVCDIFLLRAGRKIWGRGYKLRIQLGSERKSTSCGGGGGASLGMVMS